MQNVRIRIRHIDTLQFRSLSLPPYEDEREQHDIHRMGYDLRDFEAHVTRFSEYAASYSAMGKGDCCVGVFVYELRRARDKIEVLR